MSAALKIFEVRCTTPMSNAPSSLTFVWAAINLRRLSSGSPMSSIDLHCALRALSNVVILPPSAIMLTSNARKITARCAVPKPQEWPGRGLVEYQFPLPDHMFLCREAATAWNKIMSYSRDHGANFIKGDGNYPKYSCPNCTGFMRLSIAPGRNKIAKV